MHANINKKKVVIAILIADKVFFGANKIARQKGIISL